jgi:hypothetical protein
MTETPRFGLMGPESRPLQTGQAVIGADWPDGLREDYARLTAILGKPPHEVYFTGLGPDFRNLFTGPADLEALGSVPKLQSSGKLSPGGCAGVHPRQDNLARRCLGSGSRFIRISGGCRGTPPRADPQ